MLPKQSAAYMEGKAPELDEGWWSSVLADEDAYAASRGKMPDRKPTDRPRVVTRLIGNT